MSSSLSDVWHTGQAESADRYQGEATNISRITTSLGNLGLTADACISQVQSEQVGKVPCASKAQQRSYGFTPDTLASQQAASLPPVQVRHSTTLDSIPSQVQGPVTRGSDVSVGDRVRIQPLTDDELSRLLPVEGIVSEICLPNRHQPKGVLVLLEDSTMGHILQVLAKACKGTQEADVSTTITFNQQRSSDLYSPASSRNESRQSSRSVTPSKLPKVVSTTPVASQGPRYDPNPTDYYFGTQLHPLQRDNDEADLPSSRHARKDSGSNNACRPAGAMRVVQGATHSSRKNRLRSDNVTNDGRISTSNSDAEVDAMMLGDHTEADPRLRRSDFCGGGAGGGPGRLPPLFKHVGPSVVQGLSEAQICAKWLEAQERFGDNLCNNVVLPGCYSVKEAVDCLLHQDAVMKSLIAIIERHAARLEDVFKQTEDSRVAVDTAHKIEVLYRDARNVVFAHWNAAELAGDGRAAAELRKKVREYSDLSEQYRKTANHQAYFSRNASIQNRLRVDLHGMNVEEAMSKIETKVRAGEAMDFPGGLLLEVVTGKGIHSQGNVPAIKNALMSWCNNNGIKHYEDPRNAGMVILHVGHKD